MIYDIKDILQRFFKSRLFVLSTVMVLMFAMVLIRVFALQIVNGREYQENFVMRIEKTLSKEATRGNICDRNGNILAYNDLPAGEILEENTGVDIINDVMYAYTTIKILGIINDTI